MKIEKFEDKYRQAFIDLNTEWITKLFGKIEPDDVETFEHIDELIAEGAMIFFAVEDEKVLAACMAKPTGGGEWEMCKMGAAGQYTGTGAGCAVFEKCRDYAIERGAKRLFLVSNDKLGPALHIFKKAGFRECPMGHCEYERGNVAYEYIVEND